MTVPLEKNGLCPKTGKIKYSSEHSAKKCADWFRKVKRFTYRQVPYFCNYCKSYHLATGHDIRARSDGDKTRRRMSPYKREKMKKDVNTWRKG